MRRINNERGNIILTLLVTTSLFLTGNMEVLSILNQQHMQSLVDGRSVALQMAQAGLHEALWEYNTGGAYFTGNLWTDASNSPNCTANTRCAQKTITISEDTSKDPAQRLNARTNAANIFISDVRGASPVVVSTGTHTATGAQTTIQAALSQTIIPSPFQQAGYGASTAPGAPGVWLQVGTVVDSYDSSLGDYDAILNHGQAATVQSANPAGMTAVGIYGGSVLYGDAKTAGGSVDTATGTHVGNYNNNVPANTLTTVQAPTSLAFSDNSANCQATFDSFTMLRVNTDPRTTTDPVTGEKVLIVNDAHLCYYRVVVGANQRLELPNLRRLDVKEAIFVTGVNAKMKVGQGVINADQINVCSGNCLVPLSVPPAGKGVLESTNGAVDIYLRNLDERQFGEIRSYQNKPENMRIYYPPCYGSPTVRNIGGNTKFYGTLYSPTNTFMVGFDAPNVEFFGASISPQFLFDRARVHYDVRLQNATGWPLWLASGNPATRVTVTSWKQVK